MESNFVRLEMEVMNIYPIKLKQLDNINLNREIMLTLVVESNTILDSTTSKVFRVEQKFFKCKPLRAIQHVLATSQCNYSKRNN